MAGRSPTMAELRRDLKRAEQDRTEAIRLRDYVRSNLKNGIAELRKLAKAAPPDRKPEVRTALDDAVGIRKIVNARSVTMVKDIDRSIKRIRSEIESRKQG